MNNIKENEREKLHKTIWKIANELRGSVDGWDFKQYVLGLLFYRFISENIENYVNENQRKAGITDFQYRNISDEEALLGKSQILDEKGLFPSNKPVIFSFLTNFNFQERKIYESTNCRR